MKHLVIFLVSIITALSVCAQNKVTIEVNGSRNKQVLVDGQTYNVSDYSTSSTSTKNTITITNLPAGSHTLELVRPNQATKNSTTFNLRSGYDMYITVNGNGSIAMKETRVRTRGTAVNKTPMTSTAFNTLYQSVRNSRSSVRASAVSNAFNKPDNYFTSTQAESLIRLVNSEASRLSLAKLSYAKIVDPANFSIVSQLLNSQASRDELATYVSNYNTNYNTPVANTQYKTPMSATNFSALLRKVRNEWRSSEKIVQISSAFKNNYFTTDQAGQLIQLVPAEADRLRLAKESYRSITDPTNFYAINELLTTQASRDELAYYVNTYGTTGATGTTGTSGSVYTTTKVPMSDANYNLIVQDVKKQWIPGAKMNALVNVFANTSNYFTTSQAKQLIQLVSDEENRLLLAKSSYKTITDPVNFTQMYDMFSQANRNELAAYVASYNSNNGTSTGLNRVPMTDANFSVLLEDVQSRWGIGAKMSALTSVFANSANYFTTNQAKQLIQLVSSESNRLDLAKAAYRTITDPSNFSQLYDLLSLQASRDELALYVSRN